MGGARSDVRIISGPGLLEPKRGEPSLDARDVESLVAAEVAAVGGVAVAGVADQIPVQEDRATRVSEAGPTATADIVDVAGELEDLRHELLPWRRRHAADERMAHRLRLLGAAVGLTHLGAVPNDREQGAVEERRGEADAEVERRQRGRGDTSHRRVKHDQADVVPRIK